MFVELLDFHSKVSVNLLPTHSLFPKVLILCSPFTPSYCSSPSDPCSPLSSSITPPPPPPSPPPPPLPRSLAVGGGLPHLRYLDLSGLPNITERGLSDLTSSCPSLLPELLFYCDNLVEGPYATCANGCQNVGLSRLVCCRQNL